MIKPEIFIMNFWFSYTLVYFALTIDFTIDTEKIESSITDKTTAIVPVHVYGNICNIEEIDRIAKKYRLKVVYDAAHTFGVKYKGKRNWKFRRCFLF